MRVVGIQFDILTLIGILGAAQAFVVGTALLTIKDLQTRVFGLLLLSLGIVMGAIIYSHSQPGREPIGAVLVEVAISLIAPVLLFSFVVMVVQSRWRKWIPLCAVIPSVWVVYAGFSGLLWGLNSIWFPPIEGIVAYHIAYTLLSIVFVVMTSSDGINVSPLSLRWARTTVFLMALINIAQLIRLSVDGEAWRNLVPVTSGFVVIALTFVGTRHSRVFFSGAHAVATEGSPPALSADAAKGSTIVKYGSSSLSDQESERGLARFRHAMEADQAYLRVDLTLDRLAEELGLARTYLSQVINERCGRPFLEVVADYRVQEAQRILADDSARHVTVEAVGLRAGFQSKSAFYSAFKKRTGSAPAEYRRRLQHSNSMKQDQDRHPQT